MKNVDDMDSNKLDTLFKNCKELRLEQDFDDENTLTDEEIIYQIKEEIGCSYYEAEKIFKSEY